MNRPNQVIQPTPITAVSTPHCRRRFLGGSLAVAASTALSLTLPGGRALAEPALIAVALRGFINDFRERNGLSRLPEDALLSAVSLGWTQRLADAGSLSHNPSYVEQYGWPVQGAGEVVAYVSDSRLSDTQLAQAIVTNWINSPGHRRVLLGANWTDIGIGWVKRADGRLYATANVIQAELPSTGAEALALSQAVIGSGSAPRIVISRNDLAVDALGGSSLAGPDAPILFVRQGQLLPPSVLAEIARIGAAGTTVYLLGGGLSEAIEGQVSALGVRPVRLAGPSRYDTARQVAEEAHVARGAPFRIHVIAADAWADAVSIAGQSALHGLPVVLADLDRMPPESRAVLDRNPQADRLFIGGPDVIADAVVRSVGGRRLSGSDRAETGADVMRYQWAHQAGVGQHLALTPGWTEDGWATALAHTSYCARNNAPLLFSAASGVPEPVRTVVDEAGYPSGGAPVVRYGRGVSGAARSDMQGLTGT